MLERDTPPSGISGWSSKPLQSISMSYSSSSLTRQVRSATKQNGQMKSEYRVTTVLMKPFRCSMGNTPMPKVNPRVILTLLER